jgi:Protein of unknown function (DUF669)
MRFTPMTEEQIAEANLLPEGVYDFEIVDATEKTSQAGNEMIELKVRLFDERGDHHSVIFDWLLSTERAAYKLRHCCDACQILRLYENGSISSSDFLGKSGKAKVYIQKSKDPQYSDKNAIKDYVKLADLAKEKEKPRQQKPAMADSVMDDDIPF